MIKVKHQAQIHIFKVDKSTTYEDVQELVRKNFRKKLQFFQFCYIDADGDQIEVNCSDDLRTVMELEQSTVTGKKKVLKLLIKEQPIEQPIVLMPQEQEQQTNTFQILTQSSTSEYYELPENSLTNSMIVLQDEPEDELTEKQIADIAKTTLDKIYKNCLDEIARQEDELASKELGCYLDQLYNNIIEDEEQQLRRRERQQKKHQMILQHQKQQRQQQTTLMIQKSLNKLLPNFIKTLSQKTIDSVKQILASQ